MGLIQNGEICQKTSTDKTLHFVQGDKDIVTLSLRRVLKLLRKAKTRSFTFVQDDKDIVTLSLRRVLKLLRIAKARSFTFVQDDTTLLDPDFTKTPLSILSQYNNKDKQIHLGYNSLRMVN